MKHAIYSNIVAVLVVVVVFVNASCKPDTTCRQSMATGLVCEFNEVYVDNESQLRNRTTWDSISVQGIGSQDMLYNNSKSLQKLTLPLRQDAEQTTYTLTYHNAIDTIIISHTNQMEFVSVECGCTYDYEVLDIHYTHHWIDTVNILQTTINRTLETNIRFGRIDKQ